MKLFIDCEFNSFGGELISIALVDEVGDSFYESVRCSNPHEWVAKNVMPVIGKPFISRRLLQVKLEKWLSRYAAVHIVANWPEDIAHFCRLLISGQGSCIDTPPITMEVRYDISSSDSLVPHNALEDAIANKNNYFLVNKQTLKGNS